MHEDIYSRNNIKVFGDGETPLIFAHGFGCDQNMWRFVTPAFEDNYKIVLFDYVGFGNSDASAYSSERYGNLDGYAQDILDIIRELGLQKVIYVGHSVSCIIGALASIKEPELFERVIMIGPSPFYINDPPEYHGGFERESIQDLLDMMDKNYLGWANYLAPEIMKNPDRPELAEELEESFCSTDPKIASEFAKVTFLSDNRKDLPKVPVPVLVVQVSDDTIAPQEVGKYVHEHLPQSTLVIMDATGHLPHMSHPEQTIEVIKGYLNNSK